jgi:hypothetical protein
MGAGWLIISRLKAVSLPCGGSGLFRIDASLANNFYPSTKVLGLSKQPTYQRGPWIVFPRIEQRPETPPRG